MLTTYRLDNHETGESLTLDGTSYVWASLGGPVYLAIKGFWRSALVMAAVSMAIALLAVFVLGAAIWLFPSELGSIVALLGVPVAGWREGY